MTLPLFSSSYEVDWSRVMRLDGRTAAGRAFELLLRRKATAIDLSRPEISGLDYRRRITDLRKMGIPVVSEPIKGKPYYSFGIPFLFVAAYWDLRMKA